MKLTNKKSKDAAAATRKGRRAARGSTPTLSQCYLEHAAREIAWARKFGGERDYAAAATALVRRDVWLTAALIAQERKA